MQQILQKIKKTINHRDEYNKTLLFYFVDKEKEITDKIHIDTNFLICELYGHESYSRNITMCLHLIELGADVNIIDINKMTPLFYAIKNKELEIAEVLIDAGADMTYYITDPNPDETEKSLTLLETSFYYSYKGTYDIINFLIKKGLDVNFSNIYNQNILHYICIKEEFVSRKDRHLYELLFLNNININQQDIFGNTPLHYACIYNTIHCISGLVHHGADVNILNNNYQSPLICMISDLNYADNPNYVKHEHVEIYKLLIEHNAKVGIIDDSGISDYSYALMHNPEIAILMKDKIKEIKNNIENIINIYTKNIPEEIIKNITNYVL
jgi:ankyrin repeat protein